MNLGSTARENHFEIHDENRERTTNGGKMVEFALKTPNGEFFIGTAQLVRQEPAAAEASANATQPEENPEPPARVLPDEPEEMRITPARPLRATKGITLSFTAGPLTGQVFHLIKGVNESVTVGSNPVRNKDNPSVLRIADDGVDC